MDHSRHADQRYQPRAACLPPPALCAARAFFDAVGCFFGTGMLLVPDGAHAFRRTGICSVTEMGCCCAGLGRPWPAPDRCVGARGIRRAAVRVWPLHASKRSLGVPLTTRVSFRGAAPGRRPGGRRRHGSAGRTPRPSGALWRLRRKAPGRSAGRQHGYAAEDTYTPRHRGVWQGVLTFYRHGFSVILIRGARSLCTISRFRSNPMPVALPRKRVEDSSSTALQDSVSRAELGKADRHAAPFGG
jgi:hypothetical protein